MQKGEPMSDLIDRQQAIDVIDKIFPADPMRNDYTQGITCGAALATEYIKQLPSAQPERKNGKWIRHDEIKNVYGGICIECSECGEKYVVQHILDEKYCRNCGADMRGERPNEPGVDYDSLQKELDEKTGIKFVWKR